MLSSPAVPGLDLKTLARIYESRDASPQEVVEHVFDRIAAYPDPAVWIHRLSRDEVLAQACAVENRREAGESLPLFGVPFAIKDTIDLAGHPTTAACPAYSYVPKKSAPVVDFLLAAGAVAIGKTNLDQFATGLAGDRSPYGACRNVFDREFISGGSSSGSAVAVAAGMVSFAVATDTAGSGRVPAGANNIVGFKPAHGLLDLTGLVPACPSLDCISLMSLTAEDAARLYSIAQGHGESKMPLADGRLTTFAVPDGDLEFYGDEERAELFRQSLKQLEQGGARRLPIDFAPFRDVGLLLYEGPWVAERLAVFENFLKTHGNQVLPVTRGIIEGANKYRAVDAYRGQYRLNELRAICLKIFEQAEILVLPTIPALPKLAEVQSDSLGWSRRLGVYTNFANLLGLGAIAVPAAFTARGLPVGLTFLAPAGNERRLCEIAMAWQRRTDLQLGNSGCKLPIAGPSVPKKSTPIVADGHVRVSVAGAHLKGQPFYQALCRLGAQFVRACRTAPKYRFFGFLELDPPRPGLLQTDGCGGAIAVEVYDLPMEGFGRLVASVAPPLAIGTVELEDGELVKGFLCESSATARARDITDFGGWLAFRAASSLTVPKQSSVCCGVGEVSA